MNDPIRRTQCQILRAHPSLVIRDILEELCTISTVSSAHPLKLAAYARLRLQQHCRPAWCSLIHLRELRYTRKPSNQCGRQWLEVDNGPKAMGRVYN